MQILLGINNLLVRSLQIKTYTCLNTILDSLDTGKMQRIFNICSCVSSVNVTVFCQYFSILLFIVRFEQIRELYHISCIYTFDLLTSQKSPPSISDLYLPPRCC